MPKTIPVLLLLAYLFCSAFTVGANPENLICSLGQDKQTVRHKSGPEVANRVNELKRTNKNVRNALAAFERNEKTTKRRPRIDDATSIAWDYAQRPTEGVSFLKTSFSGAQFFGGTIEIISIPTYSSDGEWQGTLLAYNYDAQGNFVSEWISDVILLPDPTYAHWDAILEVSYDWTGTYLEYGTLSLYDQMGSPQGGWPATSRGLGTPTFEKARFTPQRFWYPGPRYTPTPRMKRAVKCAGLTCGSAAVGCGVGSIFFLGAPFLPCFVIGCSGGATYCVLDGVFNNG